MSGTRRHRSFAVALLASWAAEALLADDAAPLPSPSYPAEFFEPCRDRSVGEQCSVFFENQRQPRRCIEGRDRVLVCAGGVPKPPDAELFRACEAKAEKDACVAPIQGRPIAGHCNRYEGERLLCLPGPWPWRD